MVDRVKPLWEFILDFYKSRKAPTNRLALLKKEDTFQILSNSYTPELIEKVITKMLNQFITDLIDGLLKFFTSLVSIKGFESARVQQGGSGYSPLSFELCCAVSGSIF